MNEEKVLLVDDNPTNLQVLFQTLEGRGYNQLVAKNGETALYTVYDAKSHTLSIARAGHPPPILYRPENRKAIELPCKGVFPMAIDPYGDVPLTKTKLQAGDRMLLYTDGITERFNPQGKCYEVERLCEKFAEECENDVRKSMTMIIEDVNRFADGLPAQDDQAILVFMVQ